MGEISESVNVVRVEYKCDSCQIGELLPNGIVLTVYPPIYQHVCNYCGVSTYLKEIYPIIKYEEIPYEE